MSDPSVLSSVDVPWIEELHERWLADPKSVEPAWDEFFQNQESSHIALKRRGSGVAADGPVPTDMAFKQSRVDSLLWGYRDVGYLYAHLNPLAPAEGEQKNYYAEPAHTYEQLTLAEFGLSDGDLQSEFWAGSVFSRSKMKLADIIRALRETYCSTVAVEFLHIQNKPIRRWLIQEMESTRNSPSFDRGEEEGHPGRPAQRGGVRALHAHGLHRAEAVLPGRGGVGHPRPPPRRGQRARHGNHGRSSWA